jgi:hypothetical protein
MGGLGLNIRRFLARNGALLKQIFSQYSTANVIAVGDVDYIADIPSITDEAPAGNYPFILKPIYTLQGDGIGAYVNTGVIPTDETDMELHIEWGTATGGVGVTTSAARFFFNVNTYNSISFGFGDMYTNLYYVVENIEKVRIYKGGLWINDVLVHQFVGYTFTPSTYPITLFARNFTTPSYFSNSTIKDGCTIKQSDVLVRNFEIQSDGTLLDTVNDVTYSNDGTGSFTLDNISQDQDVLDWELSVIVTQELIDIDTDNFLINESGEANTFTLQELVTYSATSSYLKLLENTTTVRWKILGS